MVMDARISRLIDSLPTLTKADVDIHDHCPICYVEFKTILDDDDSEPSGITRLVGCSHVFCRKDLIQWIQGLHGSCPTCRNIFLSNLQPDSESEDESDGGEYEPNEFEEESSFEVEAEELDDPEGFGEEEEFEEEMESGFIDLDLEEFYNEEEGYVEEQVQVAEAVAGRIEAGLEELSYEVEAEEDAVMQQLSFNSLLVRALAVLVTFTIFLSLWMHESFAIDSISKFRSWRAHPLASNISLSDALFPIHDPPEADPLLRQNGEVLHALVTCIEHATCHQNQTKVVILASNYFRDYLLSSRGGEAIWAHSTSLALTNMGYTIIYTPYPSLHYAVQFYKMFPDLVKLIFMDSRDSFDCHNDRHSCTVSESNPTGIPPWKIFSFEFWSGPHNPLGLKWTVSPEDYSKDGPSNNTYLGYSIEASCRQQPFVPHHERENQAWILAKYLHYFTSQFSAAWSQADFDAVAAATGINFIMASFVSDHPEAKPVLPSTYTNYGRIDQPTFMQHLSKSRVLIGMGNPVISPSSYDALCLGVPFINPITIWDHDNPTNTSRWQTQHNGLRDLGPPYVYNVFSGDTQGFVKAVKDALANPIDSYILPRMTMSAVEERLGVILETDWQHEANLLGN